MSVPCDWPESYIRLTVFRKIKPMLELLVQFKKKAESRVRVADSLLSVFVPHDIENSKDLSAAPCDMSSGHAAAPFPEFTQQWAIKQQKYFARLLSKSGHESGGSPEALPSSPARPREIILVQACSRCQLEV